MDLDWIDTFLTIWELDGERKEKDSAKDMVKTKLKQRLNGH